MKNALKQLIEDLDNVFDEHEEVGDTDVREQMYEAVSKSFFVPEAGYVLPADFGMFSDNGNNKVQSSLRKFLAHPDVLAASAALKTPEARLGAFQDSNVTSSAGNTYDEYFGHSDKP